MDNRLSGLRAAIHERDRLKGFASRLETLQSEGALSPAEYSTGKADYDSRIASATARIETLRAVLRKELEASEREAETCRLRLEGAEARHAAGELTSAQLEEEKVRWSRQIEAIEEQSSGLGVALTAESAADLGDTELAIPEEPRAAVSAPSSTAPADVQRASARSSTAPTGRAWTWLRIAALVAAVVLLVSVRLVWLAPTALLGSGVGPAAGVSVTFIAGLAGIVCGLIAIGSSFVRASRIRGVLQLLAALLALAALVAAVVLGELPLIDDYFRQLVVLREGFFAYAAAAAALAVLALTQMRRSN
jgi:hypothetical protein